MPFQSQRRPQQYEWVGHGERGSASLNNGGLAGSPWSEYCIQSNPITLFQASWPIADRQTDTHKQLHNKNPHTQYDADVSGVSEAESLLAFANAFESVNICRIYCIWQNIFYFI